MKENDIAIVLVTQESEDPSGKLSEKVVREVLGNVKKNHPAISIAQHTIQAGARCSLPEVKIQQFPSIIVNGKQITAGSIISESRMDSIIREILNS